MANNAAKAVLIRRTIPWGHLRGMIGPQGPFEEGLAAHQLVGEVTAHQGYDGYPA